MSSNLTRGSQSSIDKKPLEDGKLRFAIDTARLFLDTSTERIEFTDIVYGLDYSTITGLTEPLPKLYLSSDTHQIMSYDFKNEEWIVCSGGVANKANCDILGQKIDETYIKSINYNTDNNMVIVLGNDSEVVVKTPIGDLLEKINNLSERLAKYERNIEIKEEES